jgi:hypothetical protein
MKRQTEELEDGEEIEDECITSFNADDWDDSALIEAWDLAKNEYLKHHGLEQEAPSRKKIKTTENESVKSPDTVINTCPAIAAEKETRAEPVVQPFVQNDSQQTLKDEKREDQKDSNPISPDQLNALMAWYWAGYYTAKLSK